MPKILQTTTQLCSLHASKAMLKILQARLKQQVNQELPDVQAGSRQGRETRDQIANVRQIIEKQQNSKKKHLLLFGSDVKETACNAGDLGSTLRSANGYLLQYSCLENPMDRGARQATVRGIGKSQTQLSDNTDSVTTLKALTVWITKTVENS